MASLAMLLNGTSLFWDHQYHKRFLEHPFLPDIRGKIVIMIQGSEGDFSERTSQQLVKLGAKVYIFDQTLSKREGLCEDDKGDVCRIQCDMTNLESVRHAALVFMAHENCLHFLFLNGQVFHPSIHTIFAVDKETLQGHEAHMGSNVLAQHLLIQLLKPTLIEAGLGADKDLSRIIFTNPQELHLSSVHMDGIWDPSDEASLQYNHHKRCLRAQVAIHHEAMIEADELQSQGILVTLVPPVVGDKDDQHRHHTIPYWTGQLK